MPSVEILVGMVASGKSTYAVERANEGAVLVSDDDIKMAVHGSYEFDKALVPLYKSTENHIFAMALALGRDVVVDRGVNVSARSRQRWIAMARSMDVPVRAVVFPRQSAAMHARRRADTASRGHGFDRWLKAAERHEREWEEPSLSEGLFSIIYV